MTFPLLRISRAALAAAALAGSLAGCAPLVIGGGAVVGTLIGNLFTIVKFAIDEHREKKRNRKESDEKQ